MRIKGLTRKFRGSRANDTPRETHLRPKRRPPRPQHPGFQRFSPRWSALWAPHHLKPRSHRLQTGEMTSLESRHADSQPLMLQNPHRHRRGGRRRGRRAWPDNEPTRRAKLAARMAEVGGLTPPPAKFRMQFPRSTNQHKLKNRRISTIRTKPRHALTGIACEIAG